jgi:hypothetical protein
MNSYTPIPAELAAHKERIEMYGLFKFLILVAKTFRNLLNVDRNALSSVPTSYKYLVMIMLSCFWALSFGLYVGEVYFIGYSMIGHIALITMAFVTWYTFRNLKRIHSWSMRNNYELLRDPSRIPKCYEMTDEERGQAAMKLNLPKG